jgi:hypothetical protein
VTRAVCLAFALAGGTTACLQERSRLDTPRITLVLEDSIVVPGGVLRGHTFAVDRSGIIFFQVTASTADSTSGERLNRISADSVLIEFELPISSTALADEPVVVIALARDDQDFEVSVTDTVYVRVGGTSP